MDRYFAGWGFCPERIGLSKASRARGPCCSGRSCAYGIPGAALIMTACWAVGCLICAA